MTRPTAVFRSVSQALHIAFLMEYLPATEKSNTQHVIELMMINSGVRLPSREDGSVNFSGLSRQEVRDQCTNVRGMVRHHCQPMQMHAIHAWFADQNAPEKIQAIYALRQHCTASFTIEGRDAQLLMMWHIHAQGRLRDQVTERAIAAEQALSQSTVHRNIVAVSRVVCALRRSGMDRLASMFERDGLVGYEEEMAM
jgi:hypothetical protein